MKISWKWCTSTILWLSQMGFGQVLPSSVPGDHGSLHLVAGFYVGVAAAATGGSLPATSAPRTSFSLDGTTYAHLGGNEFTFQIMPLHLLGKKSWNVHNQDNIEKVRRDEARAKAAEEAKEERMQEIDAEKGLQLLHGEVPVQSLTPPTLDIEKGYDEGYQDCRGRKRRKVAGEDDTESEYRVATEVLQKSDNCDQQVVLRNHISDAPLVDDSGHINLFPQEDGQMNLAKNPEPEKKSAKRKKEYEDQDTIRAARIISNDPLAAMRQEALKVRQVERERRNRQEERDKEMESLVEAEDTWERAKKRRYDEEPHNDLTLSSVGVKENNKAAKEHRHRDKRRSHDHSRRRSQNRSKDRYGDNNGRRRHHN